MPPVLAPWQEKIRANNCESFTKLMPRQGLSDYDLIQACESVTEHTPLKKIESLVLQCGTRIRNKVPVPAHPSNYARWEWVIFEMFRNRG